MVTPAAAPALKTAAVVVIQVAGRKGTTRLNCISNNSTTSCNNNNDDNNDNNNNNNNNNNDDEDDDYDDDDDDDDDDNNNNNNNMMVVVMIIIIIVVIVVIIVVIVVIIIIIIIIVITIIIAFKGAIRDFAISSLRREPSPTRKFKWPGRNRVQITCNAATWYEGTAQLLSLTEFKSHLFEFYFIC